MPYVVSDDCVLCGACVSGCEVQAIKEGETKCEIDPAVCIECGTCEANCPCQAISFAEEDPGAAGTPT